MFALPAQSQSRSRSVRIDSVYGATEMKVGATDNYRVRIGSSATWPIQYYWEMGDGTQSVGNNIVHGYSKPGTYPVKVWARNTAGADSAQFMVRVTAPPQARVETPVVAAVENESSTAPRPRRSSESRRPGNNTLQVDGEQSFAWVLGTHLEKSSAERSLREYRAKKIPGVRILIDTSGKGAYAYRVVIGNYLSLDSAASSKAAVEELVKKKVWLFAFSTQR